MQSLIDNAREFPGRLGARRSELRRLVAGQHPEVLFICCSDARVQPALITAAAPGQVFELRSIGNMAPRYDVECVSGEVATIEFAVEVLEVEHVVVCGHSYCGAVGALVNAQDLTAVPAVRRWLADTGPHDDLREAAAGDDESCTAAVRANVLAQLERLREYPCVAKRLADDRLRLHGWFYAIDTGVVSAHRPKTGTFEPL